MATIDYILYDTAVLTNVASTDLTLFQVPRGGDATHVENFTNMRGSGALPAGESFELMKIGLIIDYNTVIGDIPKSFVGSFIEVIIEDKVFFKAPLAKFFDASAYGGFYSQAAAADEAAIGLLGNGYTFRKSLMLRGGQAFRIRLFQSLALAGATNNFKVTLEGLLTDSSGG